MHFEVEQKFRVESHEPVLTALAAQGVAIGEPVEQVDCYYRHPQRDFAQTDEAFRLRSVGQQNFLTYKGPKIDQNTKTRLEEEVRLADGPEARESCDAIIRHLSFEPVATVTKQRRIATMERRGQTAEIALDDVAEIGQFVEIEISVETDGTDTSSVDAAKQALADLAQELGLTEVERRSYLELLLDSR
jgi:adenylate cyclase class 2